MPEHTPAAYLGTFHAFLWPGTQTPPPHLNQITQQWCPSTELELRIPKMYLYLDESGPVKSWSPSQELPDSPPTSPPKPLRIVPSIYQLIALDVRVPSTTAQIVIILDASCCRSWEGTSLAGLIAEPTWPPRCCKTSVVSGFLAALALC